MEHNTLAPWRVSWESFLAGGTEIMLYRAPGNT